MNVFKLSAAAAFAAAVASCSFAYGADLPKQITKAAPFTPVAAYTGFYIFGEAGIGFSKQRSELTLNGLDVTSAAGFDSSKLFATGALVGAGLGYGTTLPIGTGGVELAADYLLTRSSTGCQTGVGCLGYMKNAFRFEEGVYWSPFPKPLNWTGWQWTTNMGISGTFDVVERSLNACLLDSTGTSFCDTKWLIGWAPGVLFQLPVGPSGSLRLKYSYTIYDKALTHKDSVLFPLAGVQNALKLDHEQTIKLGYQVNFQTF